MTKEIILSEEFSENERLLIDALRNRGSEDAEVGRLLGAWLEEKEKEAMADKSSRGHLQLEFQRARVYWAAGFIEEAKETLTELKYMAGQENDSEIANKAEQFLNEISG